MGLQCSAGNSTKGHCQALDLLTATRPFRPTARLPRAVTFFVILTIDNPAAISLSADVAPALQEALATTGAALIKPTFITVEPDDLLQIYLVSFMVCCGSFLGKQIGFHKISKIGEESAYLDVHTEGIYRGEGIFPYFALGCVKPADVGGNTRVYDARESAADLIKRKPAFQGVRIRYRSGAHPLEGQEHAIVEVDSEYGQVLRFRSGLKLKDYSELPKEVDPEDVERTVLDVLSDNMVLDHQWERGDILFVNNRVTLHDRTPYIGLRIMMRVRYSDTLNCKIML